MGYIYSMVEPSLPRAVLAVLAQGRPQKFNQHSVNTPIMQYLSPSLLKHEGRESHPAWASLPHVNGMEWHKRELKALFAAREYSPSAGKAKVNQRPPKQALVLGIPRQGCSGSATNHRADLGCRNLRQP